MSVILNYVLLILVIPVTIGASSSGDHEKPRIKSNDVGQIQATNSTSDPCSPYDPPKPNFYRSDRRISETKCFDYIWQLKNRDDKENRLLDCELSRGIDTDDDTFQTIGGRITEPGEFPHMGALGWRAVNTGTWIFKCGSTLISENYLITAAHCSRVPSGDTTVANPRPEIVRLGNKNIFGFSLNERFNDMKIKRIINHPNYMPPKKYFDIAIIEITESVRFTKYIQPACLWSDFDTKRLGTQSALTGWGVTEYRHNKAIGTISAELQAAVVDIIDSDLCDRLLRPSCNRHWCGLESHQICAGKLAGGVDACKGDSGGPLQVEIPLPIASQGSMHYIIGITSFGIGCARPNKPGVYTRVSSFVDWIEDIVWRGL
ncbi:serine protease snake-like isoform X2 [Leptidea sinapis]|uniref:serine protease snake-like isoform X2 n=1 Tax=Leptidea sinapis TaxID=189913 RepID=UPI0021C3641D|nr:serine protease snake-like isoform X2 [Leptidea sinapis]